MGMRRGLEYAHQTTGREVHGLNPAVSTSFSLGTDEYESTLEKPKSEG